MYVACYIPMISPRFDYPTLTALADYVSEQLLPETAAAPVATALPSRALPSAAVSSESEHLAVLGGACHLPGENEGKIWIDKSTSNQPY